MKKRIIFVILLLFVVLIYFMPSSFAIFRNMKDGSGLVRGAQWSVSLNQTGVEDHLSIISVPNELVSSYTLNITSNSEVNVVYSIVIDNLPTGTSVLLDSGEYVQESNNKVTFTNAGTINYTDANKNKTHTLTFKASSSTSYVTNQVVNIDVVAKQQV